MRAVKLTLLVPPALVIRPKLVLSMFKFGVPQMGRLSQLMASARNFMMTLCSLFNVTDFEAVRLKVKVPSPR